MSLSFLESNESFLKSIHSAIDNSPLPLVVASHTGSGKSTTLGFYLSKFGKVWLGTFTRLGVQQLYEYSRSKVRERYPHLTKTGMFAAGKHAGSNIEEAQIYYQTTGHLVNVLLGIVDSASRPEAGQNTAGIANLKPEQLPRYLILDEIHTRDTAVYLTMALWQAFSKLPNFQTKLILTSATIDLRQVDTKLSEQRLMLVDFMALGPKYNELSIDAVLPDFRPTASRVVETISTLKLPIVDHPLTIELRKGNQQRWQQMIETLRLILTNFNALNYGHILMLVPGYQQVHILEMLITKLLSSGVAHAGEAVVLAFDASLNAEERQAKFKSISSIDSKHFAILILTASGAMSITIPRLRYVIDSGKVNRRLVNRATGTIEIRTETINYDEYVQRRGRLGRTHGSTHQDHYYVMLSAKELSSLAVNNYTEVEQMPLHKTALTLLAHRLDPELLLQSENITSYLNQYVKNTMQELVEHGAISQAATSEPTSDITILPDITLFGRWMMKLELSLHISHALWQWVHSKKPIWPGIVILSLINNYDSLIRWPKDDPSQTAEIKRKYGLAQAKSDLEFQVNVLQQILNNCRQMLAYLTPVPENLRDNDYRDAIKREWQLLNNKLRHEPYLNADVIKRVLYTIKDTTEVVHDWPFPQLVIGTFKAQVYVDKIKSYLTKVYPSNRLKLMSNGNSYTNTDGTIYQLDRASVLNNYGLSLPKEILLLAALQIGEKRFIRLEILLSASVDNASNFAIVVTNPHVWTPRPTTQVRLETVENTVVTHLDLGSIAGAYGQDSQMYLDMRDNVHLRQVGLNGIANKTFELIRHIPKQELNPFVARPEMSDFIKWVRYQHIEVPDKATGDPFDFNILKSSRSYKSINKWGQRKLFCVVLQLLVMYYQQFKNKKTLVLYIGAASGRNITLLSQLFPQLHWHLYDKSKYDEQLLQYASQHPQLMQIYHEYFLDSHLVKYQTLMSNKVYDYLILISDIRGTQETNDTSSGFDQNQKQIWTDMQLQQNWVLQLKPDVSHLKFRLPFNVPDTVSYLAGDLLLGQPWIGTYSTETRLIVDKARLGLRNYHVNEYERLMYNSYNNGKRVAHYDCQTITGNGLDHCFDCFLEVATFFQYLVIVGAQTVNPSFPNTIVEMSSYVSSYLGGKAPRPLNLVYTTGMTTPTTSTAPMGVDVKTLNNSEAIVWYNLYLAINRWVNSYHGQLRIAEQFAQFTAIVSAWLMDMFNQHYSTSSAIPKVSDLNNALAQDSLNKLLTSHKVAIKLNWTNFKELTEAHSLTYYTINEKNQNWLYIGADYKVLLTERIIQLLSIYGFPIVILSLLRYACLEPMASQGFNQWSLIYGARNASGAEAMASPFNVRTLSLPYYSLFPEDMTLGSKGNFFSQDLNLNLVHWIYPPFTTSILLGVANKIKALTGLKFNLIIPNWSDQEFFRVLQALPNLVVTKLGPKDYRQEYWGQHLDGNTDLLLISRA